jgi:hypothetical protein
VELSLRGHTESEVSSLGTDSAGTERKSQRDMSCTLTVDTTTGELSLP